MVNRPASVTGQESPATVRKPVVIAEVTLSPGAPPAKLVLFEGDDAAQAAADFAAKHKLSPPMMQRLQGYLQELLDNRPTTKEATHQVGETAS